MTDDVVIQVNNVSKKFKSQVVLKEYHIAMQKRQDLWICRIQWIWENSSF